jgi:rhodanese-related sulfurtransferase
MFWWLPFGKVPAVSAQQLDTMLKDGTRAAQLIDVRSADEWRAGHIAGALTVPVTQLGARIAGLHLDRTRPIVAMCRSGGRSKVAVRLLQRHCYGNACELQGGMRAWQRAGLPVEREAGPDAPG